jgi:hypothetical protein
MQLKSSTRNLSIALLLGIVAATAAAAAPWKTISGTFDGWRKVGDANWRIEKGEFVADGGKGHLVTTESYTDFHLKAEFFASDGKANSGIYFRIQKPDNITDDQAYEANIIDEREDQTGRTGGIPHYGPPGQIVNAGGNWNTYDITAQGDHIVLVINGIKTVDIHDGTHKSGPISLQYAAGTIKFRNVQLQKL